ncbi:NAD(P)-binding domain-containing protein [Glutamicibacter sp.]|uniref:NAD(P)-binding domain-containing protein n=1 Tax=Glutamicibacter sp. TaxID=1931995 RepID=UPI0028BD2E67|nr:NAD(P)-binding domain-containing protein [Glutamicibacter sp.]
MTTDHPFLVIGAGPIGLATAAHLHERKQKFLVLESGATPGAAMNEWSHIKLFSPWKYNVDAAARRLLEAPVDGSTGEWEMPRETSLPTGGELVENYLKPLAAHRALAPSMRYRHRVLSVSRITDNGLGLDKTRTAERGQALFLVRAQTPEGIHDFTARAVVDASGTWNTPNPVGRAGLAAPGESEARAQGRITSPLPDPLGADREKFSGKTILVLGAGHSAANTLIALGRIKRENADTRIVWGLRGMANPIKLYGGGAADQLPARGQLGTSLRRLVDTGQVELMENTSITSLSADSQVRIQLASGGDLVVDYIVPATGFRPDLSILSELRLELDPAVEAPRELGPLIDPEFHSCGTVSAHGEKVLSHPETNFYIVGMKSYGRAPTFLMATGYEQVRSIAAHLAGDADAAAKVELHLPETGVCSTDLAGSCDAPSAVETGCCAEPQPLTLGFPTGTMHGFAQLRTSD